MYIYKEFGPTARILTISSGERMPNCTRFTVRSVAFESLKAILIDFYSVAFV